LPLLKLRKCRVDVVCSGNERTGPLHVLMGRGLRVGEATTLGLQFKSVELAAMNNQRIGNARDNAETSQDRGLDWRSPATGGIVENEKILHAATVQVIEHGALQLLFRRATAVTGAAD